MPRSPSGASARPSPRVLIKSLELNALHTSRIRDMVRLNGNRSRNALSVLFAEFLLVGTRENNKDGKRKGNYWHPMLNVEAKNRKIVSKPIKRHCLHRLCLGCCM